MTAHPDDRFGWTRFYMEFADKLLAYRDNRGPLAEAVRRECAIFGINYLEDDLYEDGTEGPFLDICPFSTMASFNIAFKRHGIRNAIAQKLGEVVGVIGQPPNGFQGIPTINATVPRLFGRSRYGGADNIDALWRVFEDALQFAADYGDESTKRSFVASYDRAIQTGWQEETRWRVWNLTLGLSWARPWTYPSIYTEAAREWINDLGISLNPDEPLSGSEYLELVKELKEHFHEYPRSFPELSEEAYQLHGGDGSRLQPPSYPDDTDPTQPAPEPSGAEEYTVEDIISDGCFVEQQKLEMILHRLSAKKNLILQGPPGTGKTWLAKKLAFALIGQVNNNFVHRFQFHPNLSYEDFVRGYRPYGDEGKLTLTDGPFLELADVARRDSSNKYVMVIEEINRGNPAQTFGEMLTLLEADKRNFGEALALAYPRSSSERIFIPPNVYVIGTMNVADRSIAMVDLALRRRFAFVDLEPVFGEVWRNWVNDKCDIPIDFLSDIEQRMISLNEQIAADRTLGPQFRVGHSYVTPPEGESITNPAEWFKQVVETEIGPLLDEYWFDNTQKAESAKSELLADL